MLPRLMLVSNLKDDDVRSGIFVDGEFVPVTPDEYAHMQKAQACLDWAEEMVDKHARPILDNMRC